MKVLSIVMAILAVIWVAGMTANAGPAVGGVEGDMGQDLQNLSVTNPNLTLNITKGAQWGTAEGFISAGPQDSVSLLMKQEQVVDHLSEQYSPDYNSYIGGEDEQKMRFSGELVRSGNFDLSAFSKEKTIISLEHNGRAMDSLIGSKTLEGISGTINGTGRIEVGVATKKDEGYYQESIAPDTYSLHYGRLKETVDLSGSLEVKSCDPSFTGSAWTSTVGKTNTNAEVTPTLNSASADQAVRSMAGISGKGITGEVDIKLVTGYEQASRNDTSLINQSGSTDLKVNITKKPNR